jgi:5'-3' exonuclease
MAILVDLNQVLISGLLSSISPKEKLNEDFVRHVVLNTLRSNVKKFKEYGEVILCCDSRQYWRKQIFPHYKASRKESREKSDLDWNLIFKVLNKLKEDLKENFPYKVIEVNLAEADDIIGTLVPRLSSHEKVLILSSDADFKQLHKYNNVKQYNPMLGVYVKSPNPIKDLKEKVIRGDSGDGIPNIFSADDVFVIKKRQSPVSSKKLVNWLDQDPKECFTEEVYRNYTRNDMLINFDYIPDNIKNDIVNEYETFKPSTKQKLYKYFVENRLITLIDCIEDF